MGSVLEELVWVHISSGRALLDFWDQTVAGRISKADKVAECTHLLVDPMSWPMVPSRLRQG